MGKTLIEEALGRIGRREIFSSMEGALEDFLRSQENKDYLQNMLNKFFEEAWEERISFPEWGKGYSQRQLDELVKFTGLDKLEKIRYSGFSSESPEGYIFSTVYRETELSKPESPDLDYLGIIYFNHAGASFYECGAQTFNRVYVRGKDPLSHIFTLYGEELKGFNFILPSPSGRPVNLRLEEIKEEEVLRQFPPPNLIHIPPGISHIRELPGGTVLFVKKSEGKERVYSPVFS